MNFIRLLLPLLFLFSHGAYSASYVKGYISPPSGDYKKLKIYGWACQTSNDASIDIHLYAGGAAGTGTFVKSVRANRASEGAVAKSCSSAGSNHRFSFTLNQSEIHSLSGKSIYIHGISVSGTPNLAITHSGKYSIPVHPTSYTKGHIDVVAKSGSDYYVKGWACQTYVDSSIDVHVYVNKAAGSKLIATGSANLSSENAVANSCGSSGTNHRFSVKLPKEHVVSNMGETIKVYGISTLGTGNKKIQRSDVEKMPAMLDLSYMKSEITDNLIVKEGTTVNIDTDIELGHVLVQGTLKCIGTGDHDFITSGILVMGSNASLSCGTASEPYLGNLSFALYDGGDLRTISPMGMSSEVIKGIVAMHGGRISLHGKSGKSGYARLTPPDPKKIEPKKIKLNKAVNWQVGDEIVIASSSYDPHQSEEQKIASVSADKQTITIENESLTYPRATTDEPFSNGKGNQWVLDQRAEVINLTRNIKIFGCERGSQPQDCNNNKGQEIGANVMVMHGGAGYISNVEFRDVGQKGKLGRYPFHWHLLGDAKGQYIRDSSIHNSYNRCVVVHGTNYVNVSNNSCYDHYGHGFFLEDGNEVKNVIRGNIGLVSKRVEENDLLLRSEFLEEQSLGRWAAPATFWVSNPDNIIEDNVAAGSEGTGFWMSFAKRLQCNNQVGCLELSPSEQVDADKTEYKPLTTNTLAFNNNVAHSSLVGITHDGIESKVGLPSARSIGNAYYSPDVAPVFENLVAYKNTQAGFYFRGSRAIYKNSILADNGINAFFAFDQVLQDSLVVLLSSNMSKEDLEFLRALPEEGSIIGQSYNQKHRIAGVRIYDGPFRLQNVHFAYTYKEEPGEPLQEFNVPTGLQLMGGTARYVNQTSNLTFEPHNEALPFYKASMVYPSESAGDYYTGAVMDKDGSLTGGRNTLIMPNHPMNMVNACSSENEAGCEIIEGNIGCVLADSTSGLLDAILCDHDIGHVRFVDAAVDPKKGSDVPFNLTRLDSEENVVATVTVDTEKRYNKFPVILGYKGRYRVSNINLAKIKAIEFSATNLGDLSPLISIHSVDFSCRIIEENGLTISEYGSLSALKSASSEGYFNNGNNLFFKLSAKNIEAKMSTDVPNSRARFKVHCPNVPNFDDNGPLE